MSPDELEASIISAAFPQQAVEKSIAAVQVLSEVTAQMPFTRDSVMGTVRAALENYPRELSQFGEWFEKNGDFLVARLNANAGF